MSKANKRARWEAEAQARAEAAPIAQPELVVDVSEPEPEAPQAVIEEPETVAAKTDAEPAPAAPEPTAPLVTFAPDGTRYLDQPESGVQCECLANVIWRGATVTPPTVITLPEQDAERLERKGIVRRL